MNGMVAAARIEQAFQEGRSSVVMLQLLEGGAGNKEHSELGSTAFYELSPVHAALYYSSLSDLIG